MIFELVTLNFYVDLEIWRNYQKVGSYIVVLFWICNLLDYPFTFYDSIC